MEIGFISPYEVPLFKLQGVPCRIMRKFYDSRRSLYHRGLAYIFMFMMSCYLCWIFTQSFSIPIVIGAAIISWVLLIPKSWDPISIAYGPFPEQLLFEKRLSVASCVGKSGRSMIWASTIERLEITRETIDEAQFLLITIIFRKKLWQRRIPISFGIIDSQDLQPLHEWAEMTNIKIEEESALESVTPLE